MILSQKSRNNPIETLNVYHLFEPFDYTLMRQRKTQTKGSSSGSSQTIL